MKPIKIGTDCSGIESPIQALKKLKINHIHEWSCEIDKHARSSIRANYNPVVLFDDIRKKRVLADIDLYICGFPCQPFSTAGHRKGVEDNRGNIFYECIKVIKAKNPSYFILENVKGLLNIDNGDTFNHILKKLKSIKKYKIYYKVLNTKDYGIPQNRERVFIIGILNSITKPFHWPKVKKMKKIHSYIDYNVTHKDIPSNCIKNSIEKSKAVFVDTSWVNVVNKNLYQEYSPTITASGKLWCVPMNRYATIKELLKLQGFPKNFKQVVSDRQMSKQIGNSISVNVMCELLKVLLL